MYDHLAGGFRASEGQGTEQRWQWLMAAHIVGQADFRLHVRSHLAMLRFAARTRDWPEVAGQLFRLALVPLGHAFGRLPAGNIGRATVNAFRPMPIGAETRQLMADARRAISGSGAPPGR